MHSLSQIVTRFKLDAIKPLEGGDIEFDHQMPSKHNKHKLLIGTYHNNRVFVKIRQLAGPVESLMVYATAQRWFLEPVCFYANDSFFLSVTPFVEIVNPCHNPKLMADLGIEMLNNDIFYLDWFDDDNFSLLNGAAKVIDLDNTLATPANYQKATEVLARIATRYSWTIEVGMHSMSYELWKATAINLLNQMRR